MALTGIYSSYVTAVAALLPQSSDFRTWVGAADATAAEPYVWTYRKDPTLTQTSFAIVGRTKPIVFARFASGNGQAAFGLPSASATVAFYTYLAQGTAYSTPAADTFYNTVGNLVKYFLDNSWGTFRIDRIEEAPAVPAEFPPCDANGRLGYVSAWTLDGGKAV